MVLRCFDDIKLVEKTVAFGFLAVKMSWILNQKHIPTQEQSPTQKAVFHPIILFLTEKVGANVLAHWHTFHKKRYTKSTKHLNHQHLHALHNGITCLMRFPPQILLRGHGRIDSPSHERPPSPPGAAGPRNGGLARLPNAVVFCLGSRSPRPSHRQKPNGTKGRKIRRQFWCLKSQSIENCGHSKSSLDLMNIVVLRCLEVIELAEKAMSTTVAVQMI